MGSATGFISFILSALFPGRCLACGSALDRELNPPPSEIPPGCLDGMYSFLGSEFYYGAGIGLSLRAQVLCPRCWMSLAPPEGGGTSISGVPVIAPFRTCDTLLKLVKYLKFSQGRSVVPALSWWMARALSEGLRCGLVSWGEDPVLVPVPLHRSRRYRRGYNQAEILAFSIGALSGYYIRPGLLRRTRNTKSQSRLDRLRRAENTKGAFRVEVVASTPGRGVIVVDDLVTTGETAKDCVRALREGGRRVIAVLSAGISES